tara:strand:+ start:189 stop:509 length:321 start_codon:yes stop_codon:yes gene_type:complete
MSEKKKRIIFDDTDIRHAQLKIRLEYDGMSQAEFFRAYLSGYLSKDKNIMSFLRVYRESKGLQTKTRLRLIDEEENRSTEVMNKFGIKDDELENIFDLIANEYPDL